MSRILKQRLPEDSLSGHWVWPIGSVIGGDETKRGAGAPIELRASRENKFQINPNKEANREKIEVALNKIFAKLPPPDSFPVIFVDCRSCGKIHRPENTCNNA